MRAEALPGLNMTTVAPSPASLRSSPSPALREREDQARGAGGG
jgi:hypothetical protein